MKISGKMIEWQKFQKMHVAQESNISKFNFDWKFLIEEKSTFNFIQNFSFKNRQDFAHTIIYTALELWVGDRAWNSSQKLIKFTKSSGLNGFIQLRIFANKTVGHCW